jgi:hypothetical protein
MHNPTIKPVGVGLYRMRNTFSYFFGASNLGKWPTNTGNFTNVILM